MIQTVANAGVDMVYGVWDFFLNVEPHGFGLMLVPLIVLGAISFWAARKPQVH